MRFGSFLKSSLLPVMCLALLATAVIAQADSDDAPPGYITAQPHDPAARLQEQLDAGKTKLDYDARFGYLPALLKSLKIPTSSQGLVFSRTSFQRTLISPHNPRALYFNDDSYVGYVPGGSVVEVATMDPRLGTVFYTLDQHKSAKPKLVRQTYECMQCHQSGATNHVPGLLLRSVYPDLAGDPILTAGTFASNEQSPICQRWGGWYVTGKCGRQTHMGNVTCSDEEHPDKTDFAPTSNLTTLDKRVDRSAYLRDSSDAAALMVLAHQTHLHNLMTAANYEVQSALRDSDAMNAALHQPPGERSEGTMRRIHGACEPVVRAMLFCGEAKLSDPITGTTEFARDFAAPGPRDSLGRSLRDIDLTHRLFKYPCSYLIYSEQFDGLPAVAKQCIYRRLWQVLTGREDDPAFDCLAEADRNAVMQILRETKKDLPEDWKAKD
ncbi:MAG TPA: hypothetical protein VFE47_28305 [Tepidisphaeraceae bacterium]|jgi:hypothetical protein|nr:hypothetical protein [Tepidisphaeraceae bacterium]